MKIGITINIRAGLFSNGINQNAIYLARLFNDMGHKVSLITELDPKQGKDVQQTREVTEGIKIVSLHNSYRLKWDVLISLAFNLEEVHLKQYRLLSPSLKHVLYRCGNNLLITMEAMLFSESLSEVLNSHLNVTADQIWSIPQMERTNLEYYQLTYGVESATTVPFVWDPVLIERLASIVDFKPYSGRRIERVGVLEPNLSVMKNVFIPINIVSRFIKAGNQLKQFNTFGTEELKSNPNFVKLLELRGIKEITTANRRHMTLQVIRDWVDVVLSWQWENNLNYLPFDTAWFGYPVVHNMEFIKDLGYYYPHFSINQGAQQLERAIQEHPTDSGYTDRSREVIQKYISNPTLQQQYQQLLDNLVNDTFRAGSWNPETNKIFS